jgi:hypothetical protein
MKRQEVHDPFADSSTTPFWDLAIMLWTLATLLGGGLAAVYALGYFLNDHASSAWPLMGTLTVLIVVEAALLVGRAFARRR